MQTLATMIFDGVLDRFPRLRLGVIEQGASWVPSWMRFMDSAFEAFRKGEERLQRLSLRPSEFVQRQVRVTPYPSEDVGWIIENAGDSVCLFFLGLPPRRGWAKPDSSLRGEPREHLGSREAVLLSRQLRRSHGGRALDAVSERV